MNAQPRLLLIAAELQPGHWRDLLSPGQRVFYLGEDNRFWLAVRAALPEHVQAVPVGDALNALARQARDEFLNLDRAVADPGDLLWQASDLAERNPGVSGLYHRCCALLAGLQELEQAGRGDLAFFVECLTVGRMLQRAAEDLGWSVRFRTGRPLFDRWPALAGWAERLGLLGEALRARWCFLKEHRRHRTFLQKRLKPCKADGCDLLLTTWAGEASFPPGETKTSDPCWGGLPQALAQNGNRLVYLANPLSWTQPFEAIVRGAARSPERIIFSEQCQSTAQALGWAMRTLFWRPRRAERFRLLGKDLEPLFRDALRRERAAVRQNFALKFLHVGDALARLGLRPEALLHPFENQPWEKMLRAGFRRAQPQARTMAYMHMPFSRQHVSFFPSGRDILGGRIPDLLLVTSEHWRRVYLEAGFSPERLRLAPAVRFGHLFGPQPAAAGGEGLKVLAVGALDPSELHGMLHKLLEARASLPGVEVLVKYHPNMRREDAERLRRQLAHLAAGSFEETSEPISQLLARVDAVTSTGSGVCYEAMACGRTPVFVASDIRLNLDKLDWFPQLGAGVRTSAHLRERLAALLDASPAERKALRRETMRLCQGLFLGPDEAGLEAFFPEGSGDGHPARNMENSPPEAMPGGSRTGSAAAPPAMRGTTQQHQEPA